jgi:hypothetical protein
MAGKRLMLVPFADIQRGESGTIDQGRLADPKPTVADVCFAETQVIRLPTLIWIATAICARVFPVVATHQQRSRQADLHASRTGPTLR